MTRDQRNAIRCLQRLAQRWPDGIELHVVGTGTIRVIKPLSIEEVAAWEEQDRKAARAAGKDMEIYFATPEEPVLATIRIPCTIGTTG